MVTFDERLAWLLLGSVIGFAAGYLVARLREIKEKVDEVDKHITRRTRDEGGFMRRPLIADMMMLLVVALTAFAAFRSQEASNDVKDDAANDIRQRCEAGEDSRDVQRDLTDGLYTFVVSVVSREKGAPPLTDKEVAAINLYLDRAETFRQDTYDAISKSIPEYCTGDLADDRGEEPPTPPAPHVTN